MTGSEINLISAFDYVGFTGPKSLVLLTIIILWGRTKYLLFYFLFLLTEKWLNSQLKLWFREPRPAGYNANNNETAKYETFGKAHYYGMPSGHAMSVFYSLTYIFLAKPLFTIYSMLAMFIAAITVIHRYKYKRHTAKQLAVGAVAGAALANVAYWVASHLIVKGFN